MEEGAMDERRLKMVKEKIDQVLEEVRSLKEGQQKNYDLVQKNGVRLEQLGSDIKAVAEGHETIRSEMRQMKDGLVEKIEENNSAIKWVSKELGRKIEEVKEKVDKIDQTLEAHVRLPAHV